MKLKTENRKSFQRIWGKEGFIFKNISNRPLPIRVKANNKPVLIRGKSKHPHLQYIVGPREMLQYGLTLDVVCG